MMLLLSLIYHSLALYVNCSNDLKEFENIDVLKNREKKERSYRKSTEIIIHPEKFNILVLLI